MSRKWWISLLVFLLLGGVTAQAQGYILSAPDGLEAAQATPLYEEAGLYYTEDEAFAARALAEGIAESICEDIAFGTDFPVLSRAAGDPWWYYEEPEMQALPLFGLTGEGVTVGIIDSGICEHIDIAKDAVVQGKSFVGEDETDIADDTGHGTAIAGLICGKGAPGIGACGIAPDARLVIAKCMQGNAIMLSKVVEGIHFCVENKCDVINLSIGLNEPVDPLHPMLVMLQKAVDEAASQGVIFVASVGNFGSETEETDFISYPAGLEHVIGVGSVGSGFQHENSSQKNSSVFISAPGGHVLVADYQTGNGYGIASGTSFAAPIVAGFAALIKQIEPKADVQRVQEILKATCVDMGEQGYDFRYGNGVVNGRNLAVFLRGTDLWVRQEQDRLTAANLGGFRRVQIAQTGYNGARAVEFDLQAFPFEDMEAKEVSFKACTAARRKIFFWEQESLKPLCAQLEWLGN